MVLGDGPVHDDHYVMDFFQVWERLGFYVNKQ